jgi:1-acyl-sn-glycerol-3-phosphate acyltransferase
MRLPAFRVFKQDAFGHNLLLKRAIIFIFGSVAYYRMNLINRTKVEGAEILRGMPDTKVLFVSNHQTYFADVAAIYQVINCAKWGVYNRINYPLSLLNPRLNVYFIAAQETMKSGIIPKLFAYVGSVSIKRTWREAGQNVDRGVDPKDIENIKKAIYSGWTITFPQGTTKPFVKGRKGTAHIIKELEPIVIPLVVDGFRRAFDKKGMFVKKKGCELRIKVKEPLKIDYTATANDVLDQIMNAIEQSEEYQRIEREVALEEAQEAAEAAVGSANHNT